ncbi:MAG: hypothetical protein H8E27_05130 [Verrucomicrobia subdivision 3 bacterium]|nr:hypothetical protein [Limisphaerales bacterium]
MKHSIRLICALFVLASTNACIHNHYYIDSKSAYAQIYENQISKCDKSVDAVARFFTTNESTILNFDLGEFNRETATLEECFSKLNKTSRQTLATHIVKNTFSAINTPPMVLRHIRIRLIDAEITALKAEGRFVDHN